MTIASDMAELFWYLMSLLTYCSILEARQAAARKTLTGRIKPFMASDHFVTPRKPYGYWAS
jgi:hypothetical protein